MEIFKPVANQSAESSQSRMSPRADKQKNIVIYKLIDKLSTRTVNITKETRFLCKNLRFCEKKFNQKFNELITYMDNLFIFWCF